MKSGGLNGGFSKVRYHEEIEGSVTLLPAADTPKVRIKEMINLMIFTFSVLQILENVSIM